MIHLNLQAILYREFGVYVVTKTPLCHGRYTAIWYSQYARKSSSDGHIDYWIEVFDGKEYLDYNFYSQRTSIAFDFTNSELHVDYHGPGKRFVVMWLVIGKNKYYFEMRKQIDDDHVREYMCSNNTKLLIEG